MSKKWKRGFLYARDTKYKYYKTRFMLTLKKKLIDMWNLINQNIKNKQWMILEKINSVNQIKYILIYNKLI